MTTRRQAELTIGFAPDFVRQSAFGVPIPASYLTAAFPATSKNYFDIDETTEDIMDCTGEDFLFELLTKRLARLTIEMDVDPDILAGMVAFAYGVSAAPSGGVDEVQTETIGATGGTKSYIVKKGADHQLTSSVAHNANAADTQTALEALSNVAPGDITVSGVGASRVFTFGGNFGLQEVQLIDIQTYLLTGGTNTMAETTPGVGQSHAISRLTGYSLPLLTLYVGFRNSDKQPKIFPNVAVNVVRTRAASGGKVTATLQLVGTVPTEFASGYVMPPCMDIVPIRFGDCQMSIGGIDYIAQNLGAEFEYYYQNDAIQRFDGAGVDFTRNERANVRPSGFNLWVKGEPGDSLDLLAAAKTTLPIFVRCGPSGRHVKFTAPQCLLKQAATPIRFGGDEPTESELALIGRPRKISGNSSTPTNVTAVTSQQTAYLTAAV